MARTVCELLPGQRGVNYNQVNVVWHYNQVNVPDRYYGHTMISRTVCELLPGKRGVNHNQVNVPDRYNGHNDG